MLLSIGIHAWFCLFCFVGFFNIMKTRKAQHKYINIFWNFITTFFKFLFLKLCQNVPLKKVSPVLNIHKNWQLQFSGPVLTRAQGKQTGATIRACLVCVSHEHKLIIVVVLFRI